MRLSLRQSSSTMSTPTVWLCACLQAICQVGALWCLAQLCFVLFFATDSSMLFFWLVGWCGLFFIAQLLSATTTHMQTAHADALHKLWRTSLLTIFLHTTGTEKTAHAFASSYVDDIEKTRTYIAQYVPNFINMSMLFVAVNLFVLYIQPIISVFLFGFILLLGVSAAVVGIQVKQTQKVQSHSLSTLNEYFITILQGIHLVRYYGAEKQFDAVIDHHARRFQRLTMRLLYLAFITVGFVELLQGALLGASLAIISTDDFHSVASLFALLLVVNLLQPLRMTLEQFHSRSAAHNALERINQQYTNWQQATQLQTTPTPQWDTIVLHDVSYIRDERYMVQHINWRINKGEYWHLQGENGIGKSTLLSVLAGVLVPYTGRIESSHRNQHTALVEQQRRALCALVCQTPQMLHATVLDNLRMANEQASEQQVHQLLKKLDLHKWVEGLPQGLDTTLASSNRNLSGGQAMRLTLARALLAQRDILLLDEWRNGLDAATCGIIETLLQEQQQAGTTIIEISHTPVAQATHTCVLDTNGCTCY